MKANALRITTAAVAAILWAAILSPTAQAQEQREVLWTQLASALEGQSVTTVLVDGTVLKGRVLDVSPTDLRFEVKKTSNRAEYPKGEASVPREQLSAFSYTERSGTARRTGTAIGVVGAMAAILPAAAIGSNEGREMAPAVALFAGIGAAIGYGIGHMADTHKHTVTLVGEEN